MTTTITDIISPTEFGMMVLGQWEKDSSIDETKLDKESILIPKLHSKYLRILFKAKNMLRSLEIDSERILFLRYQWYEGRLTKEKIDELKWGYDPFDGLLVRTKEQKLKYYDADEVLLSYKSEIDKWKTAIDTVEKILSQVTWRHQMIKMAIDFQKLQNGLI